MANFKSCPHFDVHDDYYTPKSAWENINHLIPKDKVILEAFMLNSHRSRSPEFLKELGNKVVYDRDYDFITDPCKECDMIVSNPPYSNQLKKDALIKLHEVNKPFIIIVNSNILFTNYLRDIFGKDMKHMQVINPRGKINFDKYKDGEYVETKGASFYAVYLAYRMKIKRKNLWLK